MPKKKPSLPPTIDHPVMGRFVFQDVYNWWAGEVSLFGGRVELQLSAWTGTRPAVPAKKLFDQGERHLGWARKNRTRVRKRIIQELLPCYNDNWSSQDSGGVGLLDKEGFRQYIGLASITIHSDGSADWYCSDGGLFGGHWIVVRVGPRGRIRQVGLAG